MRFLSIVLIALLGLVYSATGQIPLDLVAEFEFQTDNQAFDIRHWQSDSTFGYAFVASNVICYAYDLDGQELRIPVPRDLFEGYFEPWPVTSHQVENVQLLNLANEGSDPRPVIFAVVKGIADLGDDIFKVDLLLLYDAATGELIDSTSLASGRDSNLPGGPSYQSSSRVASVRTWPPAPAAVRHLVFAHQDESRYFGQNDLRRTNTEGIIYSIDLAVQPFQLQEIDSGYRVEIIPDLSAMNCVVGGEWTSVATWGDDFYERLSGQWVYGFEEMGSVSPLTDCADLDFCIAPDVQTLFLEPNEVLLYGRRTAVRREDYSVVWRNEALSDARPRFTLSPWGDDSRAEYLFSFDRVNDICQVYRGSDGEYMGNTVPCEGSLSGPLNDYHDPIILKDGHGNDEFVTVVFNQFDPTRILRVYRPWLRQPNELVLHYRPESGQLVLRWNAVEGAREYQVFRKRFETDSGELIASVAGDQFSVTADLTGSFGLFEVRALYRSSHTSPEDTPLNNSPNAR